MKIDIVRAWKDPLYRARLNADGSIPTHPAGMVDLTDAQLKEAAGVAAPAQTTCICCTDTSTFRRCCP